MRDSRDPKFISHDLPRFSAMTFQQALEEAFRGCTIPLGLNKYIDHLTVLIDGSPQLMLLAIDLHEDLVNEEGVTIASVLAFKPTCINSPEIDAPVAN